MPCPKRSIAKPPKDPRALCIARSARALGLCTGRALGDSRLVFWKSRKSVCLYTGIHQCSSGHTIYFSVELLLLLESILTSSIERLPWPSQGHAALKRSPESHFRTVLDLLFCCQLKEGSVLCCYVTRRLSLCPERARGCTLPAQVASTIWPNWEFPAFP
jgi:hypothetical protein